jgi:hypothetical protein
MDFPQFPGARTDSRHRLSESFVAHAFGLAGPTRRVSAAFGPVTLRIETWGEILSSVALDPLRHAMTVPAAPADLSLFMLDGKETGIEPAMLSGLWRDDGDRDDGGHRLVLTVNNEQQTRKLVDLDRRRVAVWFGDASAAPEWLIYDQIRNALHLTSRDRGFGLFHAAALRYAGAGCLLTGKSGSGKSTMTAAAVTHGFETAGDDFVLVETGHPPCVHAIFDTIKLGEKGLAEFPHVHPFIRNTSRRAEDKAILHVYDIARERIVTGFPLHAVLHARLTGEPQSRIVASTTAAAYLALTPSTMFLLREQSREVGDKCAALLAALPPFAFEIGIDLDAALAELTAFLRGLNT